MEKKEQKDGAKDLRLPGHILPTFSFDLKQAWRQSLLYVLSFGKERLGEKDVYTISQVETCLTVSTEKFFLPSPCHSDLGSEFISLKVSLSLNLRLPCLLSP